jgi:hypothetical protein
MDILLQGSSEKDFCEKIIPTSSDGSLHRSMATKCSLGDDIEGMLYVPEKSVISKSKLEKIKQAKGILQATFARPPVFHCFGLHEWAMQYSGRRSGSSSPLPRHQENLPLRVNQNTIDDTVEGNSGCSLSCSHFDAFRYDSLVTKQAISFLSYF